MRNFFLTAWWSLLGAAGVIALARYLQPATFSKHVFTSILCLAFVALFFAIARKQYE